MKNIRKRVLTIVMVIALVISCTSAYEKPVEVKAAKLPKTAREAYKTILKKGIFLKDAHKHSETVPVDIEYISYQTFCMYDVNDDGLKELIIPYIHTDTTGGIGLIYSYNSSTNKMTRVITETINKIGKKGRILCFSYPYSDMGHYELYSLCKIRGNKAKYTGYYHENDRYSEDGKYDGTPTYWKYKRRIKKSEYMKQLKRYKLRDCISYEITDENIEKYIK